VKSLQETRSEDLHQRKREDEENHDDYNKKHSRMSKRKQHQQDAINM